MTVQREKEKDASRIRAVAPGRGRACRVGSNRATWPVLQQLLFLVRGTLASLSTLRFSTNPRRRLHYFLQKLVDRCRGSRRLVDVDCVPCGLEGEAPRSWEVPFHCLPVSLRVHPRRCEPAKDQNGTEKRRRRFMEARHRCMRCTGSRRRHFRRSGRRKRRSRGRRGGKSGRQIPL